MQIFVRDKSFYKTVLTLSLPIALQNLITTGVSMMDTVMIGALGEVQLSGSSLANQISFIFMIFNFGIASGTGVLTAQYWGKRDVTTIKYIMATMYRLSFIIGIFTMLISLVFPQQIMHIFSNEADVIAEGVKYLQIMSFTYLMYGITITSIGVLRTVGTVKISLVVYSISFFVNVFFNWVFIYGNLGAPRLEIRGAAIGTLIARVTEFTIIMIFMRVKEDKLHFRLKDLLHTQKERTAEFGRTATPVIINELLWASGTATLSIVLGKMGSVIVAANSICQVVVQFVSVFFQGVGNSAAVIIGNTIGQGEYDKAKERAKTFLAISVILGVFAGIIMLVLKPLAINFYNVSDATKQVAAQIMNVSAVIVLFQSVAMITIVGTLRGGGDVKFGLFIDIVFLWMIAIPLGFFTGLQLGLPIVAVYFCIKIDEVLKCGLCFYRVNSGKWLKDLTI
ncbi:putative MATE family efflux protein [Hydrogenoanaerobacterium saccharovorans]|uniref:Putative efflux protein, MATE family n=1 Tax=Hydrogenoanaerobacterium saccharovorans TaxID=474960 RepID=A0A1H8DMQ4_9FIRM|nr:MATE family efflux transporter [Hydrogenoanaerobacterium saccharovorans]RPF42259.1 putative MATE family efflux protein [Hydrogenoanaerobacterium saccharovorans]SEN07797.1 putative efflux protein, MATE family [Hydrogenoanaerobacterium saccharovorans]